MMTFMNLLRTLPLLLLSLILQNLSVCQGWEHEIPTCADLFDECILNFEKAGSYGKDKHDYRDDFDVWDFVYFVHIHSNHKIKPKIDDQIVEIYCYVTEALNADVEDGECNKHNVGEWPRMGIDLHDLFLFDGTELVKQVCRDVEALAEMECLPSVNFAYTTELVAGSDLTCVECKLRDMIEDKVSADLNEDHFEVSVKVEEYECLEQSNGTCTFVTNTIGSVDIDEDYGKKDEIRLKIEALINGDDDDTTFKDIVQGGCITSSYQC